MESPVMRCRCTQAETMMIIPSSTSSASTSYTSSAPFRTCKATKSLWKPTSMFMFASVHSSLIIPRYTVSQRSSWPTLRCVLLSVSSTGRTNHALLAPWTCTSGMPFKHTQTSRTTVQGPPRLLGETISCLVRQVQASKLRTSTSESEVVGVRQ